MSTKSSNTKSTSSLDPPKSGCSGSSIGYGAGSNSKTANTCDDDRPKLTPEGEGNQSMNKVYDTVCYVIYCPEHDQIAVTNVALAKCVWLPFVALKENQPWTQASNAGVDCVIGPQNPELDAVVAVGLTPQFKSKFLNILRIQQLSEKYITRITVLITLQRSSGSTGSCFKCCQNTRRITWVSIHDLLDGNVERLWGPEPKLFSELIKNDSSAVQSQQRLITEFNLQNALYYFCNEKETPEKKLLQDAGMQSEQMVDAYENYMEFCFPAFYMALEAFSNYLVQYGYDRNNPQIPALFWACSLYGRDYLNFHEVILGIAAMEPDTPSHNEGRANFIFRYYADTDRNYLTREEFTKLVRDSQPDEDGSVENRVCKALAAMGEEEDSQTISRKTLVTAIKEDKLKETGKLFRSSKAILPQISGSKTLTTDRMETIGKTLKNTRQRKGKCIRDRTQKYEYCCHYVTLDSTSRRCVKPLLIQMVERGNEVVNVASVKSVADGEPMTRDRYSIEFVWDNKSVPNSFTDMIQSFYHKTTFEGDHQIGLMSSRADLELFCEYLTKLCSDVRDLLAGEDKLIKINSPALVIGDLQGSLQDLLAIEAIYFASCPIIPYNVVFLGNYSGVCPNGVEVITYLFSLKLLAPNKIFLLRGTNEMRTISAKTFLKECQKKYGRDRGETIYETFSEVFCRLPFAVIVDESVFCCHSGVPKWSRISELNSLSTDIDSVAREAPMAYEMLVNLPDGLFECFCEGKNGPFQNFGQKATSFLSATTNWASSVLKRTLTKSSNMLFSSSSSKSSESSDRNLPLRQSTKSKSVKSSKRIPNSKSQISKTKEEAPVEPSKTSNLKSGSVAMKTKSAKSIASDKDEESPMVVTVGEGNKAIDCEITLHKPLEKTKDRKIQKIFPISIKIKTEDDDDEDDGDKVDVAVGKENQEKIAKPDSAGERKDGNHQIQQNGGKNKSNSIIVKVASPEHSLTKSVVLKKTAKTGKVKIQMKLRSGKGMSTVLISKKSNQNMNKTGPRNKSIKKSLKNTNKSIQAKSMKKSLTSVKKSMVKIKTNKMKTKKTEKSLLGKISKSMNSVKNGSIKKRNRWIDQLSSQSLERRRQLQLKTNAGLSGFKTLRHSNFLRSLAYESKGFETFMRHNKFSHMIRSHSVSNNKTSNGYVLSFQNRLITVFSCSKNPSTTEQQPPPPPQPQPGGKQPTSPNPPPQCTAALVDHSFIRILVFDSSPNYACTTFRSTCDLPDSSSDDDD